MRPVFVTAPLGLLFAGAGVAFVMAARPKPYQAPATHHPITPAMLAQADKFTGRTNNNFTVKDGTGQEIELNQLLKSGPVMLVFILNQCPCSVEADPFFDRLATAYAGKVTFLGIISSGPSVAQYWQHHFQTPYLVVPDPTVHLMKMFKAKESSYSVLIGTDGRVIREWPGFDQQLLSDMNTTLAAAAGTDAPSLDFSDAPVKPSSGCFFY